MRSDWLPRERRVKSVSLCRVARQLAPHNQTKLPAASGLSHLQNHDGYQGDAPAGEFILVVVKVGTHVTIEDFIIFYV